MNKDMSRAACALLLAVGFGTAANADQGDYYGALLGGLYIPDYRVEADRGLNLQAVGGMAMGERSAVEANVFFHRTISPTTGARDRGAGGSLDWHLGRRAAGSPFLLLGVGAQAEDDDVYPLANVGVGYYPLANIGKKDLFRLEARWNAVFGEDAAGDDEVLNEFRLNFGVAIGAQPKPVAVAAIAPPADSDGDGVPDVVDKCPATANWLRVDQFGCGPDADADGVPDTTDVCPDTPAGAKADEQGCGDGQRDTDGDSVTDDRDQCPDTGRDAQVEANGCVDLNKALLGSVHFGLTADGLTAEGIKVLEQVAAALRAQPGIKLQIIGHTDTTGGKEYNQRLSTRRAYAAKEFLVYRGIEADRLEVMGVGESKPAVKDKDDATRAQNRRVEFRVIE